MVANRYQNDTAIGMHTDYHNPLYSKNGHPQVVLSCNISGDGILCIELAPPRTGYVQPTMKNKSRDCWIHDTLQTRRQRQIGDPPPSQSLSS